MEHDPKQLQAVLQRAAPPDLAVTFKSMFGGVMGYAEGKPFASLSDVGLALKLAGADHAELLAQGAVALRHAPDQPASKSYVVVPDALLADAEGLRRWIGRSVAGLVAGTPSRKRSRPG